LQLKKKEKNTMINETKQQIKENETTVNRWKEERLARILNRSVVLPEGVANAFYKIVDEFTGGFSGGDLQKKIDAKMPTLWNLMPPPKNEIEWKQYFNDLLTDCAVEQCVTENEVWQIIGYDTAGFERMRGNGFSFGQAFVELYLKETDEQMQERVKDLTLEQYKERIEHGVNQYRESQKEVARLRNDAFEKFGENIPLKDGF
jgi:hypothetical protein